MKAIRIPTLQELVWFETGLGWRSSPARWRRIGLWKRSRFRYPLAIRWIRGLINSAAWFVQSITTASRNAVNRERDAAYGVVARAGLAALRAARLGAVLAEVPDPAGRDEACRCVMAHTNA
jgi:hypothetical protein